MSTPKKNLGSFITGAFLGSLVGAGVALLYAPQSGEDTRMVIKEKSIELKDKAVETGDELRHKAEEAAARKKMKQLERELRRKDKALAEAAALLVLSKKVQAIGVCHRRCPNLLSGQFNI